MLFTKQNDSPQAHRHKDLVTLSLLELLIAAKDIEALYTFSFLGAIASLVYIHINYAPNSNNTYELSFFKQ